MIKKTFSRGEMIVREGDLADSMYVIISGSAEVYIGYGTEEERHLTTLDEGSIFGEMAVLEAYPRSATVISGEDGTSLMEISTAEVSEFFREDPSQIRNIMANLSGRLRDLTDEYLEVCSTIREMKETSGEVPRSGSLLSRIEKFLKMAYLVSRTGGTMPEGKEAVQPDENEADGDGLKKIRCSRGRVLFRQGDEADCMYYIASGSVGIYANYETDDEKLLTTLKQNQFFGEMGMIEKLPRSAAAVAASGETVLKVITEADLNDLCKKAPSMVLMALQHLSSRLRRLTEDYVQACRTVEQMVDAEENGRELAEEYMKSIEYYTIMAQAYNNTMYY